MKKEDLVAMGLSDEQAQKVVNAWTEGMKGFVPKERLDEVSGKLKEANATIETLKKGNQDNEELQKQVTQYKETVAELEKAAAATKKEAALKEKLAAAGVLDADYLIYKQGGVDKFNFDKDGKPIGLDDLLKPVREASPHLFKADPGAEYTPAGGGTPPAANPWKKETFNLTEQGRIYKENPTMAKQMASAAGVTI
ncbi:MAG: phage scaffolding protein [Eubacteriales bacterium]|nr:phage scaffolding protein [Eubacteriales bacterium]